MSDLTTKQDLKAMYRESAEIGADNLYAPSPVLKIHTMGKSQNNTLADGSLPQDGQLFYSGTKIAADSFTSYIMTIGDAYRCDGLEGKTGVFTQIVGGVLDTQGELLPFVSYFTGLKLENLWKFASAIAAVVRNPLNPVPMFAIPVTISSELKAFERNKMKGQARILKFDIGTEYVDDVAKFLELKALVPSAIQAVRREALNAIHKSKGPAGFEHENMTAGEPPLLSDDEIKRLT